MGNDFTKIVKVWEENMKKEKACIKYLLYITPCDFPYHEKTLS